MRYVEITPNRPTPMEPLPATDTLLQFESGLVVRLRVTAMSGDGQVRTASPEPGANETVNMKLQCSLCKDDSGDVRVGLDGNHLVLAAEVHGVSAEALLTGSISFEAWLAERTDTILQRAAQKAHVLDRVLAKYYVPQAEPVSTRVTRAEFDGLLSRVTQLELGAAVKTGSG